MNGLPISYYNLRKVFFVLKIVLVLSLFVFIGGNIINLATNPRVRVKDGSYIVKSGVPLFTDGKEYIRILKSYPHSAGVKLKFHRMGPGESYWDAAFRNGITVETLLAANPFITSLLAEEGVEIVLPADNGVLTVCRSVFDAWGMEKLTGATAQGKYARGIFELFASDDIRFAFYPKVRPAIVNNNIEGLYSLKRSFDTPCYGSFGSLFGMRPDPFTGAPSFHQGLDILGGFGNKIRPIQDGIVSYAGWRDGYGNCVMIMHRDGYISLYGHCERLLVKQGEFVTKKTAIGIVGNTGRSTGPHVHLEIERHGRIYNPLYFIW